MKTLTTTQFAQKSGVPAHTLRRLHSSGDLIPAVITRGGHRRYSEDQLSDACRYVRRMKLLPGGISVIEEALSLEPFFAYLLGLIMADGTVLASGQVQLELKDKQIMDDVAALLGVEVHPRSDRPMFRMTVPRGVACRLVEYGVCRRKSKGFDVPSMSGESFGNFLRGLFDGDGSASVKGNGIVLRFHGHPRSMGFVQATLLQHLNVYMPWVKDNRIESGMLEVSRWSAVKAVRDFMYLDDGPRLERKRVVLYSKKEE